jgi:hypothetical protein
MISSGSSAPEAFVKSCLTICGVPAGVVDDGAAWSVGDDTQLVARPTPATEADLRKVRRDRFEGFSDGSDIVPHRGK